MILWFIVSQEWMHEKTVCVLRVSMGQPNRGVKPGYGQIVLDQELPRADKSVTKSVSFES